MAARVAAEILDHVEWTEARASDVMSAIQSVVETRFDAFAAVASLVDVVRRKEGRNAERVARPLSRAARTAFERRKWLCLRELLIMMLDREHDAVTAALEPAWVDACVRRELERTSDGRDFAGALVTLFTDKFGFEHRWLFRLLQDHSPALLERPWFDVAAKQRLHRAGPTAAGWTYLAGFAAEGVLEEWDQAGFREHLDVAIAALLEAVAVSHENDASSATAVVLAGWLSQLVAPE